MDILPVPKPAQVDFINKMGVKVSLFARTCMVNLLAFHTFFPPAVQTNSHSTDSVEVDDEASCEIHDEEENTLW